MASDAKRFEALFGGESQVDMYQLRESANYGVPAEVRARVWKYLLRVLKPDQSQEMELRKIQSVEFEEAASKETVHATELNRLDNHIQRHCSKMRRFNRSSEGPSQEKLVKGTKMVVHAYINNNTDFDSKNMAGLISLVVPLLKLKLQPFEVFCALENLVYDIEEVFPKERMGKCVGQFITFFRVILPQLYCYFEEEEIDANAWVPSWLGFLLARELNLVCLYRLWDTYLSCDLGLELHTYVCLAILVEYQDELMELEHSEIMGFLQHLPPMDMDQMITQAYNTRGELSARELL
eukprot:TRINITY_DN12986_c0_g1_i1.p1 TRINITY_DN12986_c0_g1~~TRINITY_DN12986_c0_g1_i1.p1  ORF type:complete len:294 (+),score=57.21 TRINITY_DN12986_c0_g1_i1:330-1211(+)